MDDGMLAKKLGIKMGHRVLVLNAPTDYLQQWRVPKSVQIAEEAEGVFDLVHLFAANTADLNRLAAIALGAVAPSGRLWISFPKGSSSLQTDLTRDRGWGRFTAASPRFMSLISVNEVWSAARFNPSLVGPPAHPEPVS